MGTTMKRLTYGLVFAMLIMLSASSTRADVADPRIGAGGGGSCGSVDLTSVTSSFTLGASELGCIVDFTNDTPGAITQLEVDVNPALFSGALTCGLDAGSPFSSFEQPPTTAAGTCLFLGANVPIGGVFGLTFGSTIHPFCLDNPTTGACDNLQNLPVTVSSTPEPASIALIGTGLAAWLARRKKLGSELPAS
jgi:PEP-CTERM motif-containing protein